MKKKLEFVNKIYPWYVGLSSDLIFFIAINSIWLTTVKGFSFAQISFFTTISSLFGILFQYPSLRLIKKIGNTTSIRFGSFLFLIASLMLTFCTKYVSFVIANILYETAFVFTLMSAVLIKNNLMYLKLNDEYVKIRSKSSLIYAISTALITLLIGLLFNLHKYLPMILGIITCVVCLVLSFFIFDVDEKIGIEECAKEEKFFLMPKPMNIFIILLLFYGIAYSLIVISQQNSKLLMQSLLLDKFSVAKTTMLLGIVLFLSRLLRVIINYFYPKIYKQLKNKVGILISLSLLFALVLIVLAYYINFSFYFKLLLMVIAFSFFPALRDPINIFIQNMILEKFSKDYQKDSMVFLSLSKYIGQFITSAIASIILLKLPIQFLFILFIFISIFIIMLAKKIFNIMARK